MANESESRGSGRDPGSETGDPQTERKQPIGGGQISRPEERSGRVGGEGHVTQQSEADADGPSQQTSTAGDELGQI